jgi:hypothetical protein
MERAAFDALVFGPAPQAPKAGGPAETLAFLRFVAHRVAYLCDQTQRALPAAVDYHVGRAEAFWARVGNPAFPHAADDLADAHDRVDRLLRLQDEYEDELHAGAAILSYAADASLRTAQADVRRDDADLAEAHRLFLLHASAWR